VDDSPDVEDLQQQMAALRVDVHRDVEGIVHSARELTDWRYYLRKYPCTCLGSAALAGYLVVPSRAKTIAPDVDTLVALAKKHKLFITPQAESVKRGGLLGTILGLAMPMLMRSATGFVSQQLAQRRANTAPVEEPRAQAPWEPRRPK